MYIIGGEIDVFVVLEIEPGVTYILDKCSTTQLCSQQHILELI